jgi:hypothetical protein
LTGKVYAIAEKRVNPTLVGGPKLDIPAKFDKNESIKKTGIGGTMEKIIEYRILYSSYIEDLQNQVNALIKMGWIPRSELCFGAGIYHQTMVLIEKEG